MKIKDSGRQPRGVDVKLDWRAYYQRFCEEHGDPVEWKGRLLFADGWGYSNMDYAGPEYPPPEIPDRPGEIDQEKLKGLQVTYWKVRYKLISRRLAVVRGRLQALTNLSSQKSLPLQGVIPYYDEETGRKRPRLPSEPRSRELDLEKALGEHRQGIVNLESELARCVEELKSLISEERNYVEQ